MNRDQFGARNRRMLGKQPAQQQFDRGSIADGHDLYLAATIAHRSAHAELRGHHADEGPKSDALDVATDQPGLPGLARGAFAKS